MKNVGEVNDRLNSIKIVSFYQAYMAASEKRTDMRTGAYILAV